MEYLTYRFKCKMDYLFLKTWTTFFSYASKRLTNIMSKGMIDGNIGNWLIDILIVMWDSIVF